MTKIKSDVYEIHEALTKAIDSYGGLYCDKPVFEIFEKEYDAKFEYLNNQEIPIRVQFDDDRIFTCFMLRWS